MAQINKPSDYFNIKLYTGDGSSSRSITGVGFQPDWIWVKERSNTSEHQTVDKVRGPYHRLQTNSSAAEGTDSSPYNDFKSFDSDGFSIGNGGAVNANGDTYVAWNWLAAGTAPSKTYTVKVVSDSGNKYRFDDFGTSAVTLEISEGGTYRFDQSDSSNSGHPLRFSTTSDGTHGGGSEYTTGVTTNGTPGSAGAYTEITVAASAPTLYYYCTNHSGMGGTANTPTTNSFSNFDGSIQSNVSPNTTSGFSIVTTTGTGANATIGHGLGSAPSMIIGKRRDSGSSDWRVYNKNLSSNSHILFLNNTNAEQSGNSATWNNTAPTSSVFSVGTSGDVNASSGTFVFYCFAEKKGYSKFGSYTGNGNADGTFVYTGFKPAFVIIKYTGGTSNWIMMDNKRPGYNVNNQQLKANLSDAEDSGSYNFSDFYSNGFKLRNTATDKNGSGNTYIYMAFAENPLVGTNNIPANAR